MSYPGHSLVGGRSYPSAEKQSVYSAAPANWATFWSRLGDPKELYVSFMITNSCFLNIPLLCMVKFESLAQFPVNHFSRPSSQVLYSFISNLLYSLSVPCFHHCDKLFHLNLLLQFSYILIYLILMEFLFHSLWVFHTSISWCEKLVIFHWSLSDSKSPQVSKTSLRILVYLNDAVVWMVSVLPDIQFLFFFF